MAPEVRYGEAVSESADVWSFGVLLWELLHLRAPGDNERPSMGRRSTTDPWEQLMLLCRKRRPADRPSARLLSDRLRAVLEA